MPRDPHDPDQLSGYDETQRAEIEEAEGSHVTDGVLVTDLARERMDADAAIQPTAAEEELHDSDTGAPNKPGADPDRPAETPATETQSTVTPDDYPDADGGKPDYK